MNHPRTRTIIVSANTPWVQQLEIWMTPYGFVRAAAANNATVKAQTVGGRKYTVVTFMGQNKANVNGFGDMPFEAIYTGYKDFGGVKFPTKIVQKQGAYPILDLRIWLPTWIG